MPSIEKLTRFMGGTLIVLGLTLNPWVVEYIGSPDHQVDSIGFLIIIAVVDVCIISLGFLFLLEPLRFLSFLRKKLRDIFLLMFVFVLGELVIMASGIFLEKPSADRIRYFRDFLTFHPELGYTMHPNLTNFELTWSDEDVDGVYSTDEYGFRNPGISYTSSSLFFIGDSFTMASWVPREDAFFSLIGKAYGRESVSLAVGGYGMTQYEILAQKWIPRSSIPKTVFINIFANDLESPLPRERLARLYEDEMLAQIHIASFFERFRFKNSATGKLFDILLKDRESALLPNGIFIFTQRGASQRFLEQDYGEFINSFSRLLDILSQRSDIQKVFIVLIPSKESVYHEEYASLFADPVYLENEFKGYTSLKDIASSRHVPILDLTETFRARKDDLLYFSKDGHWTREGHRVAAEAMIDWLHSLDYNDL